MPVSLGRFEGASDCSAWMPHAASSRPAAPLAAASTRLSVSICLISRRRPAPSAARIASSFCREAARVSRRLATLAQAMRRTNATVAKRINSGCRTSPTISSCIGTSRTPMPAFTFGYWRSRADAIASISACAAPRSMPGFSRPMTCSQYAPRDCMVSASASDGASGVHTCAVSGCANDAGITPTISRGAPFNTMDRPTTAGSPPKRVCHRPWLRMATRSPPSRLHARRTSGRLPVRHRASRRIPA